MSEKLGEVKVREEIVEIPTYGIGKPDKNPMFLEKRVYQGSSGKVYPHPVIDKIEDDKKPQPYKIIYLENDYLHVEIMPELGGRIYRALDKTNNYDFVYYNRVIKPALVGLAGPWISGGIEFNWPQHHRPNTYGPVEYAIRENADGSKTVWVSEVDRMYGTKGMAGFTLYPGKAFLEISGQLYNRTPQPQTFLWWANPAVSVHEHTQSVFPPDVCAVFDHGKRDVSRFPIATGTYYKNDYSSGVDISRYKNIPVPTSYMAFKSDYNFVGGYDHSIQAGILHVANHHISPGKKQWTWGHGEFGQAWDRNLTDEDGPYIELMTGVYTDNQPDFTWLQPYEEKTFKQYFMPYKNIGVVKNATIDAALGLEVDGRRAALSVYATSAFAGAEIVLTAGGRTVLSRTADLSPTAPFTAEADIGEGVREHELTAIVRSAGGRTLVEYRPKRPELERMPEPAKPIGAPEELRNTEALFLAAQHLEQYRHATYEPEPYYLEGLKRDSSDIRLNNAYGMLLLRRGLYRESERHFRQAGATSIRHNPNPYDSEPHYNLGLALKAQGRLDEAYAAFYKATWSAAWQDKGFYALAQIACAKGELEEALELAERSIMRHYRHYLARNLKTAILRKLGRCEEAVRTALETICFDIGDFGARNELAAAYAASGQTEKSEAALRELGRFMRGDPHNYLVLAQDYAASGLYAEAVDLLRRYAIGRQGNVYPIIYYALGYIEAQLGHQQEALMSYASGESACSDYCFPNSLFDLAVLETAVAARPQDSKAHLYLGHLLYDKRRHDDAIAHWELAAALDPQHPAAFRNLALAYYNKRQDAEKARASLETAFSLDPRDARVFYELDQLYKKLGLSAQERLNGLDKHPELVEQRDDLYIEYVTLLNVLNRHEEARERIGRRKFHPWEGGEGKVTSQYVLCHAELAKAKLAAGSYREAADLLELALHYPDHLGEGKLAGAKDNHIHYYLGLAYRGLGQPDSAERHLTAASQGEDEPASAMFYNDQPPEMIYYQGAALAELDRPEQARSKFNKLADYGEKHLFVKLTIDYFAVSLPDFLVFDENLDRRNEIHCRFMSGLGYFGLGDTAGAAEQFRQVLALDPCHQGAHIHLKLCQG